MLDTVGTSEWILAVAEVAAQLKVDLLRVAKTSPVASRQEGEPDRDLRRQMENEAVQG